MIALLAIGRLYDERLSFGGVNISLVISFLYLGLIIHLIISKPKISSNWSLLFLIIFTIYLLFHSCITYLFASLNSYEDYSFIKIKNFLFITFPISIFYLARREEKNIKAFFTSIMYLSTFMALSGAFILILRPEAIYDGRLSVLGGGPIVFSRWVLYGVIFALFFPRVPKTVKYLYLPVGLVLALASGSKGPLMALSLSLIIYFIFFELKQNFMLSLVALGLIVGLIMNLPLIMEKLDLGGNTHRILLVQSLKDFEEQGSTLGRIQRINVSLKMIRDYPQGVGIGNWASVAETYDDQIYSNHETEYPHNFILEVFSELGIIGGVILFLFIGRSYVIIGKLRHSQDSKFTAFLFCILTYFILNTLVSGDLSDTRTLLVISAVIGSLR